MLIAQILEDIYSITPKTKVLYNAGAIIFINKDRIYRLGSGIYLNMYVQILIRLLKDKYSITLRTKPLYSAGDTIHINIDEENI